MARKREMEGGEDGKNLKQATATKGRKEKVTGFPNRKKI
jgi:hypothetical protein